MADYTETFKVQHTPILVVIVLETAVPLPDCVFASVDMKVKRVQMFALMCVVIVGTGVIQGKWTNRWNTSQALARLSDRLDNIPTRFGAWTSEPLVMSSRERELAGATSALARRYVHETTGESFSLLVLAGLPAHISAHTPEVCYPAAGYTLGPTRQLSLDSGRVRTLFNTATATAARTQSLAFPSPLTLVWCWDDGTGWTTPNNARFAYMNRPALCKLYFVTSSTSLRNTSDPSHLTNLLRELLPELHAKLFSEEADATQLGTSD